MALPFAFTPPWSITLRQWLVDSPNVFASTAGRWTAGSACWTSGPPPGARASPAPRVKGSSGAATGVDVGLDGQGVVRRHQRVGEPGSGDRLVRGEALRKIAPLEHPRDSRRSRQAQPLGEVELAEPLAVESQLGPVRVDDRRG